MNATSSPLRTVLSLLCALAVPMGLAAEGSQHAGHVRYSLEVLGALGGTFGEAHGLNNRGSTAGQSLLIGDSALHAFFWQKGVMTDLGTFGGNSLVNVANHTLNEKNMVVGFSETSTSDPNGDDFCGLGNGLVCLPFVWENGVLTALPTLGGNNGQALGINNRGQIAGQAETPNVDPCSPFARQVEAVIWQDGVVREILPPFGGTAAVANAINDNGQAVGISGCNPIFLAVLWKHGTPINLGSLGGVTNNFAFDINNKGQVVGQSDLPGDILHHAFLWQEGVMTDLGSLCGALPLSQAIGINNQGQVVGFCQDVNDPNDLTVVAVLWENGAITDLNTVIPAGSPLFLMEAAAINDRGEIAGWGRLANGEHRPFLLTPCDGDKDVCDDRESPAADVMAAQPTTEPSDDKPSGAGRTRASLSSGTQALAAAPESTPVRQLLLRRLGFGGFTATPQKITSDAAAILLPTVSLSPTDLTFSTQAIGTTSARKTVALKNTGTTTLTISGITIVGTNAGDFAQTHTCGSSLAAGASCSISVTFKPTASGTRTAALSVMDNAAGSPQKVGLTGVGTTARLSLTSLSFGAVVLRTSSPAQTVTLTNVGTTTLTISGIAVTGTNAGDFAQTHTCGSSLAAGASCTVSVAFKPTQIGNRSGTLSVTDNAPGSPQTVSLSGTGTEVALSPTSLRFACFIHNFPVPHCVCFTSQTATLTNVGRTTLDISGIAISGGFSQTNSCDASVAAGGSCSINVRWSPGVSQLEPGSVSISDNGGASPQMLGLLAHKLCTPQ